MAAAPVGAVAEAARPRFGTRLFGGVRPFEALALLGIVVVAAIARFASLPTRGTWDADQGHDMLVLTQFVQHGAIPLLGPPTSIGTFHHGVLYYYLLAPAAWLGGGDPTVVVGEIALAGVLAVIATWGLARVLGTAVTGRADAGRVAGLAAAVVLTVSATAVEESTFIWNPNLIGLSSALTLIAAWRAWESGRARWWLGAGIGQAVTMHCHVLGSVMLLPLVGLFLADVARRSRAERPPLLRWGLAASGAIALSYVPLLLFELGHDFSETRGAVAFLAGGGSAGSGGGLNPLSRIVFGLLRVLAWPMTGLVTDAPLPGALAGVGVLGGLGWMLLRARERSAALWIAAALLVPILLLALGVSGLSTVTALPTDHYHAFLDPLIIVIVGIGIAALWVRRPIGRGIAAACLVALAGWNVAHWPPAVAADGGWPAAQAAAQRIGHDVGDRDVSVVGLPPFKTPEAYAFPLTREGHAPVAYSSSAVPGAVVVLCDDLFVRDCGGPAESRLLASTASASSLRLVDRFSPAPRRTLSAFLVDRR